METDGGRFRREGLAGRAGTTRDVSVLSMGVEEVPFVLLEGVVVRGDGRGRELGFPTANVEVPAGTSLPADGIYAGWLERSDGKRHLAAISIGTRPTYYGAHGELLVEAFVLDFEDDLYGERVRVGVGERVRGQVRFEGEDELVAQMALDADSVRRLGRPG